LHIIHWVDGQLVQNLYICSIKKQ